MNFLIYQFCITLQLKRLTQSVKIGELSVFSGTFFKRKCRCLPKTLTEYRVRSLLNADNILTHKINQSVSKSALKLKQLIFLVVSI